MSDTLERKSYKKGQVIFKEGDWGMCMYEIVSGTVAIYADFGQPSERLLRSLEQWECFGEMGLVNSMPRSATAVAEEDCSLLIIDGEHFDEYFHSQPRKVYKIMQQMSDRIRALTDEYMEACGTIAEYLEGEEQQKPRSENLLQRMAKFVGVYNKGKK